MRVSPMGNIRPMSMDLDEVCKTLKLSDGGHLAREVVATRVIELARRGVRSAAALRDRVLSEANGATAL